MGITLHALLTGALLTGGLLAGALSAVTLLTGFPLIGATGAPLIGAPKSKSATPEMRPK
jgi:hypothetical protein